MEVSRQTKQLTSLLDNAILSRIERLRLSPERKFTNRSQGEHLSGKGGTSTEFSDYRDYVPGDDVRYVDWNIFSRLNRPYLKLYQFEEEMHVVILIDGSSSMLFEDKLILAKRLAAAFGLMGLMNVERVSVYASSDRDQRLSMLPPCTGRGSMKRLFAFIEQIEGGGDYPLELAIEHALRRHRGRGVIVLLSDFLTFDDMQRPLNMLFSAGLEIFALQILGPSEVEPEVTGDLRFVDSETGGTLDISSAGDLLTVYHDHRAALQEHLALSCRKRHGKFLSVISAAGIDWILLDLLRRHGWVQ